MEDHQYGMGDLRQFISSRPLFPPIAQPPPPDLLSSHRGLSSGANPYDMLMFRSDSISTTSATAAAAGSSSAAGGCFSTGFDSGLNNNSGGGDGGAGRWPRQETLTLLEIRSRLDPKFKEANQKGPLWDEVSRIMCEEHGYQRSGKKCREKFENLYKYYKKTKEGKAGRQDGKHYRFFRQLEALYGSNSTVLSDPTHHLTTTTHPYSFPTTTTAQLEPPLFQYPNNNNKQSDTSLSLSNYSDAETSSSSGDGKTGGGDGGGGGGGGGNNNNNWKLKIKDFIDAQMTKLMDKQEAWMEKMMRAIEHKERERVSREEEWRKMDAERIDRERKFWAGERAWIEARDAALMEALSKLTGGASPEEKIINNNDGEIWPEGEMGRLVEIRRSMEVKFEQIRGARLSEEIVLWDEIATKMACLGYDRSPMMCKDKWDSVVANSSNDCAIKCNKKRKENSKSCGAYYNTNESGSNRGGVYGDDSCEQGNVDHTIRLYDHGNSSPNNNNNNHHNINGNNNNNNNGLNDSCFRYFLGDAYGRIME
ncbi:hypothetical protein ABFS83_10G091600 [Erythranthe nasuta]